MEGSVLSDLTIANYTEIKMIIDSVHNNPHNILGMHEYKLKREAGKRIAADKKRRLVVNAYYPSAEKVYVLENDIEHEMVKTHLDGFFQLVLDREDFFRYKLKIVENGVVWETYDPYSFLPTVSEMDLYLFGEGTHYEIYNKLGAHLMIVDGVSGVSFAVWAPNARRVCLVGDFNNWDGRRCQMRALGASGVWELFVPGLCQYDKYKFEIKTADNRILHKQDPYGNFAELRPSTASLVFDIHGYEWNDDEWRTKLAKENPLNGPINIYELHAGSWKRKQDDNNRFLSYMELADELIPYVKNMGYTHVEMMPITEHPFDGSWGYQVTGYYAVTSRYGNPKEFMYFVDKCHQNGIGVLMDWVPAHFPKDAHGLAEFDGTALYEHLDPRKGEHPEWGTKIFNFGRSEVKNFLIANALFWIENFHIDGLRVDAVASMLYLDYGKRYGEWLPNGYGGRENLEAVEFMKHMNSVILGRYPHVQMIAEESTSWAGVTKATEFDGLGFSLKWNMGWMNDFLRYVSMDSIFRKHHHNNLTFGMVYQYSEKFTLVLSHDEVVHGKCSLIGKMPGDIWQKFANLRVALGFMYGHPGKKLLFMGGEFGQFIEWDEKKSLDWFLLEYPHHAQMLAFSKDLNHFYKGDRPCWYDDFNGTGFEWINCDDAEHSIFVFARLAPNKGRSNSYTIFICNFTPKPYYAHRIGVPQKGRYKEVLNSDDAKYGGSGIINEGNIKSEEIPYDKRDNSIVVKVPPLGVSIIKRY